MEEVPRLTEIEENVPFLVEWLTPIIGFRRLTSLGQHCKTLIDLSDVEHAQEQKQDPNLWLIKAMNRNSLERPLWEHGHAESPEVKVLWSQYVSLKIWAGTLLRHCKNQNIFNNWQVVTPQSIHTRTVQACHHHKLPAHQGIVFYWPNMQKDVEPVSILCRLWHM